MISVQCHYLLKSISFWQCRHQRNSELKTIDVKLMLQENLVTNNILSIMYILDFYII